MRVLKCEPCAESAGVNTDHPAEWLAWQVGDRWVPICEAERLTWWEGENPAEVGAPDIMFVPIPVTR